MPEPSSLLGQRRHTYKEPLIGFEEYDDFTREGTSTYSRALRIGRKRWRIEIAKKGIYVRLGAVDFQAGFDWADE
jgi:hypothetical protein